MTLKHFIPPRIRQATRYVLPTTRVRVFRDTSELPTPVEDPLRRWVRQREKERQFNIIPPPRMIPQPKKPPSKLLKRLDNPYRVDDECLQARLDFLLSEKAAIQQKNAPMHYGETPGSTELYMFQRQLRELRRIYRLQYMKKLEEVIDDEREKQKEVFDRENADKWRKRVERHQAVVDEQKRQSLYEERKRVDRVVYDMMESTRKNAIKKEIITSLGAMEEKSKFLKGGKKFTVEETFDRGKVFAPDVLRDLDKIDDEPEAATLHPTKRPPGVEQVYRDMVKMSYSVLAEDEPSRVDDSLLSDEEGEGEMSEAERARVMFSAFTEDEKLTLLRQKIDILQAVLDNEPSAEGADLMDAERRKVLSILKEAAAEVEGNAPTSP